MSYIAFELDKKSRRELKKKFPPKFSEFIGHHVTYKFGVPTSTQMPPNPKGKVIGYVCNDRGLEALVIEINGKKIRPDGKIYHITWSLDRSEGFKPVHSNALLEAKEFEKSESIDIKLTTKMFK